ncbi:MAG TPA: AsnC family transcriptional regulator, partial [Candidatus Nanoarchaeia archaeon]|nr:AsnC family transcriptional regulator [Candidatus Nanoarchaeia archaeon]
EIMQIDPRIVGYNTVVDLGISTAVKDEAKVIEFLETKPYVAVLGAGAFWKYNIRAFVVLANVEKLAKVLEELEADPNINQIHSLIWTEVIGMDHPENLLINGLRTNRKELNQNETDTQNSSAAKQVRLDETDRQIARILTRNARTPFKRVAEEIGISTKSVIQRYQRIRGKLLTLSTITVDLKKLGYNAMAHVLIKASKRSEMPRIQEQVLEIPNAIVTYRLIGEYDLRVVVAIRDFDDVFALNQSIRGIQGIDQADVYLIAPFPEWPLNVFASLLQRN